MSIAASAATPQVAGRAFWSAMAHGRVDDEQLFLPEGRHDYYMPTMQNIQIAALRKLVKFESEAALKMAREAGLYP